MNTEPDLEIYTRLFNLVTACSPEERTIAYVDANRYEWPDIVSSEKPDNWDNIDSNGKFPNQKFRLLVQILQSTTSEYDRSRMWWRMSLQKTSQDHKNWWLSERLNHYGNQYTSKI